MVSPVRSYSFVVFGDARPARRRRQPRRRRTPLDHRQHDAARQRPTAQPARPVDALKQRGLRFLEAGGGDVRLERLLGPVGAPARRAACRPSRAAAATPESPAGSSPDAASPPPRSPARSCTPSRSAAPGPEDRPSSPRSLAHCHTVQCTKLNRAGPGRIRDFRHRLLTAGREPSGAHEAVEGGMGHAGDLGDGGLGNAQLEEAPRSSPPSGRTASSSSAPANRTSIRSASTATPWRLEGQVGCTVRSRFMDNGAEPPGGKGMGA